MDYGDLRKSPYSLHFYVLSILGMWLYETKNSLLVLISTAWRLTFTFMTLYGAYTLIMDLYTVLGDFKKMSWNLSITLFFVGSLSKNLNLIQHILTIDNLRKKLYSAEKSRTSPDDVDVHKRALQELKYLRLSFYGGAAVFIPMWLVTRYFSYLWGPKELLIPVYLPIEYDLEDDFQYNYLFVCLGIFGLMGIVMITESELAMFSLLIQISREYSVLLKDIPKINEFYQDCYFPNDKTEGNSLIATKEINPWLRTVKTKILLKELSNRQQKIYGFIEEFESCYNSSMLVQLFGMSILVTFNAYQCLLASDAFTGNVLFQLGYLTTLLIDLFMICFFSTRLRSQCYEVGEAIYSTFWYRMGRDLQKDILMMIVRAQHPPKITAGKLMEMNLNVFMQRMSNIYSWVALFRQVEIKS